MFYILIILISLQHYANAQENKLKRKHSDQSPKHLTLPSIFQKLPTELVACIVEKSINCDKLLDFYRFLMINAVDKYFQRSMILTNVTSQWNYFLNGLLINNKSDELEKLMQPKNTIPSWVTSEFSRFFLQVHQKINQGIIKVPKVFENLYCPPKDLVQRLKPFTEGFDDVQCDMQNLQFRELLFLRSSSDVFSEYNILAILINLSYNDIFKRIYTDAMQYNFSEDDKNNELIESDKWCFSQKLLLESLTDNNQDTFDVVMKYLSDVNSQDIMVLLHEVMLIIEEYFTNNKVPQFINPNMLLVAIQNQYRLERTLWINGQQYTTYEKLKNFILCNQQQYPYFWNYLNQ